MRFRIRDFAVIALCRCAARGFHNWGEQKQREAEGSHRPTRRCSSDTLLNGRLRAGP